MPLRPDETPEATAAGSGESEDKPKHRKQYRVLGARGRPAKGCEPPVWEGAGPRTVRSLKFSTLEGAFGNADASIRNSYTTPFALFLGASSAEIGIMASVQSVASTLAQIPAARMSSWLGSRKRVWFASNVLQKAFWIPIIFLPFLAAGDKVVLLIMLLGVASFFTAIRTPAWSSLMSDIVPRKSWGKFFGWRNTMMSVASLLATLAAAQVLIAFGFPTLLGLAFLLGAVSILLFTRIHEPHYRGEYHYTHSLRPSLASWRHSIRMHRNFAVFTSFMTAVNFAVYIAAPFISVYMLVDLGVDYGQYAVLVVIESLATLLAQPYWGRMSDRIGDRRVLVVTGVLICFVPFYWLFVRNPFQIVFANIASGFAWAGFNIAAFNFLLSSSPQHKRAEYTANNSFFTGIGVMGGALTGSAAASAFHGSSLLFFGGLQMVFMLSFLARLSCLLFLPFLRETRVKETAEPMAEIFWRSVAVWPARGIIHVVIAPSHFDWRNAIPCALRDLRRRLVQRFRLWRSDKERPDFVHRVPIKR
jgi:MFS family permease